MGRETLRRPWENRDPQYYKGYLIYLNAEKYYCVYKNNQLLGTFITNLDAREYIDTQLSLKSPPLKSPKSWVIKVKYPHDSRWYIACNKKFYLVGTVQEKDIRMFSTKEEAEIVFENMKKFLAYETYEIVFYE